MKGKGILVLMILINLVFRLFGNEEYVESAPPPNQQEKQTSRPDEERVWIPGHWVWEGKWTWQSGHWEKKPANRALWNPGFWSKSAQGWKWVEGSWYY